MTINVATIATVRRQPRSSNALSPRNRPGIRMIDSEADTLSELAITVASHLPEVSAMLMAEIGRAAISKPEKIARDIVTMYCTVDFTDTATGATRTVELVYPKDADIEAGRISILTPVGAALIGLRTGQSIVWPDRSGNERTLVIGNVRNRRMTGRT